ncbi:uncharacterized protein LOC143696456 [Agelaius phoeniceus]|uniref:uncharacterized protein LOC143696456 n=1 Tax=Agelaius phoeniceus TaxID=39638 RepID=UPI0040551D37
MAEPPSWVRGFPQAGSKSGSQQSSSGEQGHPLRACQAPIPSGRWTGFAALMGPVCRVRNRRGAAAPPVTPSVSERARSVRPEQPSVLRSRLSKRHQPGASRTFPADEAAFLRTRDRHPQQCEREVEGHDPQRG